MSKNDEHPNDTKNIDTEKKVMSETMICSVMMSTTAIKIITTSTTMVQKTTTQQQRYR